MLSVPHDTAPATDAIASAQSFLFVPGDRPERFDKAVASGADIVVLDLEDAVAPDSKVAAREAVAGWLAADRKVLLRINGVGTPWHADDLDLCAHDGVLGVMLPKAEGGAVLTQVARQTPTVALIESARGIETLAEVTATPGVARLAFGTIDLALDLETESDAVIHALGIQLAVASRARGLAAPIDGVTRNFRDAAVVEEETRQSRSRGFGAKLCIHPAQIAPVRAAFIPSEAQIAMAQRIVEADRASGGRAVALDGQMVDKPVVDRAYRLLRQSGRRVSAVGTMA